MISNHPDTGSNHPTYGPLCLRTCIHSRWSGQWYQWIWGWTQRIGHGLDKDTPHPDEFGQGGGPWGGCGRVSVCVGTSQNCVKIHGTCYKPLEGPSEEPEVQGHLRRVRGCLLDLL